jgi:hypothetical protein
MSRVTPCYVYLICGEVNGKLTGPCKVGISDKPAKRLKQVQTGSPVPLVVAFAFRVWDRPFAKMAEHAFHASHSTCRMHGEWFDLAPADALGGLVSVFKMGFDQILPSSGHQKAAFDELAEASNLIAAVDLLYRLHEAQGLLKAGAEGSLN